MPARSPVLHGGRVPPQWGEFTLEGFRKNCLGELLGAFRRRFHPLLDGVSQSKHCLDAADDFALFFHRKTICQVYCYQI